MSTVGAHYVFPYLRKPGIGWRLDLREDGTVVLFSRSQWRSGTASRRYTWTRYADGVLGLRDGVSWTRTYIASRSYVPEYVERQMDGLLCNLPRRRRADGLLCNLGGASVQGVSMTSGNENECPTCHGNGEQTVTVTEWRPGGGTSSTHKITCVTCRGAGTVSAERLEEWHETQRMWCGCDEPDDPTYYADGEHPSLRKHHWRCSTCDGVTQIG